MLVPLADPPVNVDLHIELASVSILPASPRLGNLSKLCIPVQRPGGKSGLATAKRGSSLVGRLDHGLSRAGKVGPDVVDLAVSLRDGDVVQPVDNA